MATVYLSPSRQFNNPYAAGNTSEGAQMNRIGNFTRQALERAGVRVIMASPLRNINRRIQEANSMTPKPNAYVAIHSNAGGGHYTQAFYNPNIPGSHELAKDVYDEVVALTKSTPERVFNGVTWMGTGLAEIKGPTMPDTLIEVLFHDNPTDAQFIIDNAQNLGNAIARGILKYLKVSAPSKTRAFTVGERVNIKPNGRIYTSDTSGTGRIPFYKEGLTVSRISSRSGVLNPYLLTYNGTPIGFAREADLTPVSTEAPQFKVGDIVNFKPSGKIYSSPSSSAARTPYYKTGLKVSRVHSPTLSNPYQLSIRNTPVGFARAEDLVLS